MSGTELEKGVGSILVGEDELQARVRELGHEISEDYAGRELLLVGVLKGAVFFMADLMRAITVPCEIDFMAISSYGAGTDSSGASPVQVEMIGNVVYTLGNGPFFGTITFTAANGSTLGVRMDGRARALPNGTDASFRAGLTVIGGTGQWLRARGAGRFTGSRKAALGSTVQAKFVIRLRKAG